jgi:hypothetical protein
MSTETANQIAYPTDLASLLYLLRNSTYDDPIAFLKSVVKNTNVYHEADGRTMLSFDKRHQPANSLQYASNGIILDRLDNWKVLSLPSKVISYKYDSSVLRKLSSYSVYYAIDGTVVTLYNYRGTWMLASANGMDVRNHIKFSGVTFWEALMSVFGDNKLSLDTLDTAISYTLGFRHADFHPLNDRRSPTLWLISASCLSTLRDLNLQLGITKQPMVKEPNIKYINKMNNNALKTYLANGSAHYGFILRNATGNYVIESTLMKNIRLLMYHQSKVMNKEYSKYLYLSMKAYLKPSTNKLFTDLFPQFMPYYTQITDFFNKLVVAIIREDDDVDSPLECLAAQLRLTLSNYYDVHDHNNYKIIYDSLLCSENLDVYMAAISF